MTSKLLGVVLGSMLALGCNTQHEDPANEPPVVTEAAETAVEKTDLPTASVEPNASDQNARDQTVERLKSIAKAFWEYRDHFGYFPPAASTDANGKLLLSWRVHILPFLDAYDLYQQFRLDEPWNSDHNLKLVDQMPVFYQMTDAHAEGKTSLMVFTGDYAVFGGAKATSRRGPLKPFEKPRATNSQQQYETEDKQFVRSPPGGPTIFDLTDGTSNTILAVYAGTDKSIPWTKPEDLPFQPDNPVAVLGNIPDNGFITLFWDSRVERLPKDVDPARLNSFIDSTEHERKRAAQEAQGQPSDAPDAGGGITR